MLQGSSPTNSLGSSHTVWNVTTIAEPNGLKVRKQAWLC